MPSPVDDLRQLVDKLIAQLAAERSNHLDTKAALAAAEVENRSMRDDTAAITSKITSIISA